MADATIGRPRLEAAIRWLVLHPVELEIVEWLAEQEMPRDLRPAHDAAVRSERRASTARLHGCPTCRCYRAGL